MKTLWDTYANAYDHACQDPWRVYEKSTGKLLSEDYRNETTDDLDERKFCKATKKKFKNGFIYWRIVVY